MILKCLLNLLLKKTFHINLKINRYRFTSRNKSYENLTNDQHTILSNPTKKEYNTNKQRSDSKSYKRKNSE